MMAADAYDYIVVGSGSAGGAIVGRLSENGKYNILCLEAGTKGSGYIFTKPPAANVFLVNNPKVDWRYRSEPDETHGHRELSVPRGKILGGSSAINGTIYNRGQKRDYDTWAQMGCRGWGYDDVLRYMKNLERTEVGDDRYRGRSGPIHVNIASKISPFYDLFIQSANAIGIPSNSDYSGESQEGVAMAQQAIHRGYRQSTATGYIDPARKRKNVSIIVGAEAKALILEGKRCIGVRYEKDGVEKEVRANHEVIVSCGAANSPKLLELSGIGNPEILGAFGIETVHALPGVGENLRDHYAGILKWRFNQPGISVAKRGRGLGLLLELLKYGLFRRGFISQGMGTLRVFSRSRPGLDDPDIMMVVAPFLIEMGKGENFRMSATNGFFLYSHVQRTESTGSVHIRSSDFRAPPVIRFRFLDTPNDRQAAIRAVRQARQIAAAKPLADYIDAELQPGRHVQTDDEILEFLRNTGQITHHMVGTCRMGHDPMAVVDDRLRVHGMEGLRVADASIMPTIPSGNTSIPCMVVGEKCAAMVLHDGKSA